MGKSYLTIVACFSVGIYLESVFERMLMFLGHTKEAMICQVTGAVVNIFPDFFLKIFAGVTERFVLPLIFVYLFARIAGLDLVWWAFTLAEVLGLLISAGLLKYVFRRKIG